MKELSWNIDTPMYISIKEDNKIVMTISVCEVIESSPREKVMQHIAECDRTPWLRKWHNERQN
jgi:hypothetical protein